MIFSPDVLQAVIDHIDSKAIEHKDTDFYVEIGKNRDHCAVEIKHEQSAVQIHFMTAGSKVSAEVLHKGHAEFLGTVDPAVTFDRLVRAVQADDVQGFMNSDRERLITLHDYLTGQQLLERLHSETEVTLDRDDTKGHVTLKIKHGALSASLEVSDALILRVGGRVIENRKFAETDAHFRAELFSEFSKLVHNVCSRLAPIEVTENDIIRLTWLNRPVSTDDLLRTVYGAV